MARYQLSPQKPPGSSLWFSRTGVQPCPGSSTIEPPSAFVESGAYPPDRALSGSPRQCALPPACRHPPEGRQIGARKRRAPRNTVLNQPYCRCVSTDRLNRDGSQLAASLEGGPGATPAEKTLPHSYPETRFRRERARGIKYVNKQFSYSSGVCVCVCYIQFAGYTCVYTVSVCNSYVESNSVLLVAANDNTTSAVLPTRRGAHEKTYGTRNRRRNVYASLEVWMLWLGCLSITTVHGACV